MRYKLAVSVCVCLSLGFAVPGFTRGSGADSSPLVILRVAFTITNGNAAHDNDSLTKCPGGTDDQQYTIPGRLVGPRSAVGGQSVTLDVHGVTTSQNFQFTAVPGHDYQIQMAQLGHTSVAINQLGKHPNGLGDPRVQNPPSGGLNGKMVCNGSLAEVQHQIISELRTGSYTIQQVFSGPVPTAPTAFRRVALAGLSGGADTGEIEAYSWSDIDALILMGRNTGDLDPRPGTSSTIQSDFPNYAPVMFSHIAGYFATCILNPPPSGYTPDWLTPDLEVQDIFYRPDLIDPAVITAFKNSIEQEPCGLATSPGNDQTQVRRIAVPVLLVWGDQDQSCPATHVDTDPLPGSCQGRAIALYQSRPQGDTTAFQVCLSVPCLTTHSGHELILEASEAAHQFRTAVDHWLTARGF